MPITCPVSLRPIDQQEFIQIDYRVMGHSFDSHNELGRLCDENIYQNDLVSRIESAGHGTVRKEIPVTVTHRGFAKTYRLDLVVDDAAIYELKTESRLALDHDAQLLNYLFLHGVHHGKLVNFRPPQVQSRFVNTLVTTQERHRLEADTSRWQDTDGSGGFLRDTLLDLLDDWGGFLELPLYTEAMVHFLGGEEKVVRMVSLARNGLLLGNQRVLLATPDTAFKLTAFAEGVENLEPQLHCMLRHSSLRAIQWVNMARHRIGFVTLVK